MGWVRHLHMPMTPPPSPHISSWDPYLKTPNLISEEGGGGKGSIGGCTPDARELAQDQRGPRRGGPFQRPRPPV